MLQKKLIQPGEGARITTQVFRGGWRGYQGHTLIVRLPNSRSNTFRVADVVTEGIQGQPQLTFDSREAAIAWKESHPDYADGTVGRINRDYMCIKIPLEDGSEAWLAESNFPNEGSPEGDRLVRLYPDYFRNGPGFFLESINRNFTTGEEISNIVTDDNLSPEEKATKLGDRPLNHVIACVNQNLYNRIPAYGFVCDRIGVYSVFYDAGIARAEDPILYSGEEYCHSYTNYVAQRTLYGGVAVKDSIEHWERLGDNGDHGDLELPEERGFFTEKLNEELIDNSEDVERIVHDENLTPEQKAENLGERPLDDVIRAVNMNFIAKFQPEALPEGIHGQNNCYRCGVKSVFIGRTSDDLGLSKERDPILASGFEYCSENAYRRSSSIDWGSDVMDSIIYGEREGLRPIEKVGFFKEKLEKINTQNVYKIKTRGTRGYSIKVNKPNSRHDTFDISVYRLNPYSNAAGWSQIYFPTEVEAKAWLENFKRTNPEYRDYDFYVYKTTLALPSDLIKVPLEDGSEAWMHKGALPPIDTPQGRHFEELYPEYFQDEVRKGFFTEDMITESYSQPRDEILKVILDYVKKNGYIKGTWNGRYATPSPTVEEINAILRHSGNLEDYQCEPALVDQFKEWFASKPKNNDWLIKCEQALEKEAGGDKDELKVVVALASLFYSEQAYQQRQTVKAERERQHQEYIDRTENSGAGEVGQDVEFIVAEAKINAYIQPNSYYASSYPIGRIKDEDGRIYFGSDTQQEVKLKPGMKIKARIKKLDEFRGIKQTKIWKVQIIDNSEIDRAFFTE